MSVIDPKTEPKLGTRLIFAEGLLQNYFHGAINVDIRFFRIGSNNFHKGQFIEGHFLEDLNLPIEVLKDSLVCQLGDISQNTRNYWGRPARPKTSRAQMLEIMQGYYPDMNLSTIVSVNWLRIASSLWLPVDKLPEHNKRDILGMRDTSDLGGLE